MKRCFFLLVIGLMPLLASCNTIEGDGGDESGSNELIGTWKSYRAEYINAGPNGYYSTFEDYDRVTMTFKKSYVTIKLPNETLKEVYYFHKNPYVNILTIGDDWIYEVTIVNQTEIGLKRNNRIIYFKKR